MNIMYKYLVAVLATIMIASSCTKVVPLDVDDVAQEELLTRDMKRWAEEKELQKKQDESDAEYRQRVAKMYDDYYAALREYKKNPDHKIVYGWFRSEMWKAIDSEPGSFLFNLADSIDVVSIWGGIPQEFGEDDPRWKDLKLAQEVKGLKVLLCWQTGRSGLGLPGGAPAFDKRHEGKNSVEKAKAYAQELTEHIKRLNLNGYDIDWEPTVGDHNRRECANLYKNCDDPSGDSSAPIRAFITEMGKNFGPKQETDYNPRGTGTMFLFDCQMRDMEERFPDLGDYFDYFVEQNYWRVGSSYESGTKIKGWSNKKLLLADEFERYDGYKTGGGKYGNEANCIAKAKYIKDKDFGGWACYHIELDPEYKWSRQVIQIMNPTTAFFPKENTKNNLLDK
ncbi:hypothetical protein IX336_001285 [Porphyromonas levii]|uniref:glycoside hydrolase family 18 n=1 Tax=Porphyromonas levii TaxID=28114 RepID=UPI001BAA0DFA|nr:glycoside hydrolase family 18 [Porphyromonas levii]MBR8765906.1 hypothetical protein [Porphyromonas levii]